MIVFNIYAVLQAIVAVACLGILQLLINLFHLDYDIMGGTRETVFSLQFMAFITAFMDARGTKGRLFFLPTWLVLMAGSFFVFYVVPMGYLETGNKELLFLYASTVLIVFFYLIQSRKYLEKLWAKKQTALDLLRSASRAGQLNDKDYWLLASHIYYRPSAFFFYTHRLWRFLFRNVIDGDDFLQYYKYFVNTINIDSLTTDRQKRSTTEFRDNLNQAQDFESYSHEANSIHNLGLVIDNMNDRYKV